MGTRNFFTVVLICLACLVTSKAYCQSAQSYNDLKKYNNKVNGIFSLIINRRIGGESADEAVKTLQESSTGSSEEYCELVNEVMPKIIYYLDKGEPGIAKYFIKRGEDILKDVNKKIENLTSYTNNLNSSVNKAILQAEYAEGNVQYDSSMADSANTSFKDTTIIYSVKPGDNLWNIANKEMDSGFKWSEIFQANKETLIDPNLIFPEQKLKINMTIKINNPVKDTLQNIIKSEKEPAAANNDSVKAQDIPEDENSGIGDLVIDHTQSKWGRDFVSLFNKYWNPPASINSYTIIIEERPLPRFGTVILIKVNGNYIYQKFIQPRYESIEMNAEQGTQLALAYLENYRQIQKDLQGEDMKGTGIF